MHSLNRGTYGTKKYGDFRWFGFRAFGSAVWRTCEKSFSGQGNSGIYFKVCYVRVPLYLGLTNASKITGDNTEDNMPVEGYITFDIKTSAVTKERIKIIINVEAQKSTSLNIL